MKDYYLILGIEPNATLEDIKKAYREMSLKYHPDKNKGDKYFEERFKDIKEAYDILSDNVSRQNYDYQWLQYFRKKKENKEYHQASKQNISTSTAQDSSVKRQIENTTKSRRPINVFLIIVSILLIIYILISKNQTDQEIQYLNNRVSELTREKDEQLDDIRFLIDVNKKLENANNELLSKSKKSSIQTNKPITVPFDNAGLSLLSNKVYVKNEDEIVITRIEWEAEAFEGRRELSAVSVLNKKAKSIFDLKLFYEVLNSQGQKVDAGEVILFEGFERNGVRQPYNLSGRQVYANSAVEWNPHNVWIRKRDSEYMVISIKSYDTD